MRVTLKLFAWLRKYQQEANCDVIMDDEAPATVEALLKLKGVPVKEAPVILVNGIRTGHSHILHDGDTVSVFPLIGGG